MVFFHKFYITTGTWSRFADFAYKIDVNYLIPTLKIKPSKNLSSRYVIVHSTFLISYVSLGLLPFARIDLFLVLVRGSFEKDTPHVKLQIFEFVG